MDALELRTPCSYHVLSKSLICELCYNDAGAEEALHALLDCNFTAASQIFGGKQSENAFFASGNTFCLVAQYLTSFDDSLKQLAAKALKQLEQACTANGTFRTQAEQLENANARQIVSLQLDIVLADSHLCSALLSGLTMDFGAYLKAGWLIRRAWKLYDTTYTAAQRLWIDNQNALKLIDKHPPFPDHPVANLLASVSFGFGLAHLLGSILPPHIGKVVQLFGLVADRRLGVDCLRFSAESNPRSLKGTLANLALLWFHAVLRPFFAASADSMAVAIADAEHLLSSVPVDVAHSLIFTYFRGRLERLRSNFAAATTTFEAALASIDSTGGGLARKELALALHYELAWSSLAQLEFARARASFERIRVSTKLSPAYYLYLCALCAGAEGDEEAGKLLRVASTASKSKANPVEAFIWHKTKGAISLPASERTGALFSLYSIEMLYHWRCLPTGVTCSSLIGRMVSVCEQVTKASSSVPTRVLSAFIEGVLLVQLGNETLAIERFKTALEKEKANKHVTPFACFELGAVLCRRRETAEAGRKYIVQARDKYRGFAFESRLSVRIAQTLRSAAAVDGAAKS